VASDGTLRDRASNRAIATVSVLQELAIDSRLPDSAWDELKYIDVRNDNGGSVHLFVQAFTRIPSTNALHGSYVKIHSTIGTIILDGDLMTFSDNLSTGAFADAQFAVTSSGRRLVGIIYLIGFFNQIPSFDGWNTTYDTPPLIPSVFYANASLLYACTYGNSNLCDNADVPAEAITVLDDKLWAVSRVDMWADLNAGIGKEVYWFLAGNPGWTFEKHLDLNAKTEHTMQTWQGSNENYFCRTTPQPEYLSTWLSPLSAASARASYKGEVDGTTYGALEGELLHHFQIKPLEAEHISLDFYTHLVGSDVIPAFVQLRVGPHLGDEDARFIAYKFDSFQPLQSLPPAGAIFDESVSPDPFNVTHCADTLTYTDQDQEGTKIHPDNKITSTDPLATPLSRTALTYVLGDHPTWKASEIVAWEDQLGNNFTEYVMYQKYIDPQPEFDEVQALIDSGSLGYQNGTGSPELHNGTRRALTHYQALAARWPYAPGGPNKVFDRYCQQSPARLAWCAQHVGGSALRGGTIGCVNADESTRCSSITDLDSSGFPQSLAGDDDAIFPCGVSVGYPIPCRGSITCSTPDVPLCGGLCAGLVTGSVSGSGSWDCADDLSSCEGSVAISGGVQLGIPNCKWCPSALEFSVTFAATFGSQACCSGPFAYIQYSITLAATFVAVVQASMTGTFYTMATKDDNACRTARPNWIQNDLRDMVISGKVDICFLFCFSIVSGNLFMVPEVAPPVARILKKSGQCCVKVGAWLAKNSCDYCPRGDRHQHVPYGYATRLGFLKWKWTNVWGCASRRKCA